MLDFLCQECHTHFDQVRDDLVRLKTHFVVDKTLVRGFDYYNRTVFEITTDQLGAQNAVGGGGRYDKLVEQMGGAPCPAVGYAGGVERLVLLISSQIEKFRPALKLFFICPDEKGREISFTLANDLRRKGIRVDLDYSDRSMKSQMKRADKLKAENVLIIGGSEIEQGIAVFRNMNSKVQENIKLTDLKSDL